jgi:hypothetical protein
MSYSHKLGDCSHEKASLPALLAAGKMGSFLMSPISG